VRDDTVKEVLGFWTGHLFYTIKMKYIYNNVTDPDQKILNYIRLDPCKIINYFYIILSNKILINL
jgi:hypothetical protein